MHYSSITPKNRIGGREATRQAPLPVVMGLGDDFINFDDDPDLPPGAIMKTTPAAAATADAEQHDDDDDDDEEEEGAWREDREEEGEHAEEEGVVRRSGADPTWCPPGTADRLRKLKSPLVRLHSEIVDFWRGSPTHTRRKGSSTGIRSFYSRSTGIEEARFTALRYSIYTTWCVYGGVGHW